MLLFSATTHAKEKSISLYDIEVTTINGETVKLDRYRGQVILIVNVASRCGFTSQYDGLEALYRKYREQGLVVLGFPCNQFGSQEPGSEAEIQNFCRLNYGVSFPMFAKINVNGENAHPLYKFLKSEQSGFMGTESIKWNFTKFLVDQNGKVLNRFASATTPASIESKIKPLFK
ncbi:MAG: glutathione peroxidase [Campylobacterota bacterium]|nr:glutathione peroxidase [Campylobacterota bacterium]